MKQTANRHGWISPRPNEVAELFISHAATASGVALDIGAAEGVTVLAALARGANMIANDIEPAHLAPLAARVSEFGQRLTLNHHRFPSALSLPRGSLSVVNASLVLHFLRPSEVREAFQKLSQWLEPGGRFYSVSSSPYVGNFRRYLPEYARLQQAGELWPGFVRDVGRWSDPNSCAALPPELLLLDVDSIYRVIDECGLEVDDCWYFRRRDLLPGFHADGRENIGLIASRPVGSVPLSLRAYDGTHEIVAKIGHLREHVWNAAGLIRSDRTHVGDPADGSGLHWALIDGDSRPRAAARLHILSEPAILNVVDRLYPTLSRHLRSLPSPVAFFSRLVVDDAYRRRGLARRLDLVRAQRAFTLGARSIAVLASGSRAQRLKSKGLKAVGLVAPDERNDGISIAGEVLVGPVDDLSESFASRLDPNPGAQLE